MADVAVHRKVMFLNDEPAIGNLLALLKRFDRENALTETGNSFLDSLDQNKFDAIILDLRSSPAKANNEIRGIGKIRAGCMGKLLVIVADVNGPKTLELLERYLFKGLPEGLLWLLSHHYPPSQP